MGAEIRVNSLDEMCDLMCDNKLPRRKEVEKWWYFTFCYGQEHEGYYVKIWGTYGSAREKMFEKYGTKWGFQYSEKEWKNMEKDPQRTWEMEKELEVIK